MMSSLAGKVAIITGASSGIGKATAQLFSKHGAKLVLTGRNQLNLEKVIDGCTSTGQKAISVLGDITNSSTAADLVDTAKKSFGQIDILVNSAGILVPGSINDTSLEQYDQMFNINCRSVFNLTKLCVPHLIESKGNIVNVSSVNGIRSFAGVLAYNMSKAALDQFTRCVALELAENGVRVNSVNPGVTLTELQKRGGMDQETYDKDYPKATYKTASFRPREIRTKICLFSGWSGRNSHMPWVVLDVQRK